MSRVTVSGISQARQTLAELAAGLRAAASGEVVKRAADRVRAQVEAIAKSRAQRHADSGAALAGLQVTINGGLVKLEAARYLSFHTFWPFRKGMPGTVVKNAVRIFAEELLAVLGRGTAGAERAEAIVDAAAEADAKKASRKAERAAARKAKAQGGQE